MVASHRLVREIKLQPTELLGSLFSGCIGYRGLEGQCQPYKHVLWSKALSNESSLW